MTKVMQPHEVLGVECDADFETIRRAYLKRATLAHPDAGGSTDEFIRLRKAYEALSDRTKPYQPSDHGPTREHRDWSPNQSKESVDEILRKAKEHLAREAARRVPERREPMLRAAVDFGLAVLLTPLGAAAIATCLCYNGVRPPASALWSFCFVIAMGLLVYLGGLGALVGATPRTSGLKMYRRIIILVSIGPVLIVASMLLRAEPPRRRSANRSRSMITRDIVPKWWPVP